MQAAVVVHLATHLAQVREVWAGDGWGEGGAGVEMRRTQAHGAQEGGPQGSAIDMHRSKRAQNK
jgi:hypothetical protein